VFIEPTERLRRCSATSGCERMAKFTLTLGKFPERKVVHLCSDCFTRLYSEMSKNLVPKSIKSKFLND